MQCYYFEFVVGGLAGHVITWVEVVLVPVLISFLLKKFHVITFYVIVHCLLFFFPFLPAVEGGRMVGRSLRLYCPLPLTSD